MSDLLLRMNYLYQYILESLRHLSKTQNHETQFHQYLRSLKPSVRSLRKAYADHQITVDYSSPEIQAAYLIAYYPQYAEMTFQALHQFRFAEEVIDRDHLTVCLFGSGPSPEIIGLLSYLNQTQVQSITIETFDIAADTWKLSRDITVQAIRPQIWKKEFSINSHTLDFCEECSFHSIQNIITKSQLFVFQNCLNELFSAKEVVKDNIEFLLEKMPESSTLIIADQSGYQEVIGAMDGIESLVSSLNLRSECGSFLIERLEGTKAHFLTQLGLPQVIRDHLLTGANGLIPRKKVKASYFKVLRLVTAPQPVVIDRAFIAQLEAELHTFKQVEQSHFTAVLASIEQLSDFAKDQDIKHTRLAQQLKQLKTEVLEANSASQLDQAIQTATELRSTIEQLQATLDQETSRFQQAIQMIEQRLDRAEQHHALQLDRDTLLKRLKQNRQITIALAFISLMSFITAAIALFR